MKAYINIKNDSDLHSHQTLNKRIGLMKRERQHNAAHRFSFGKRFDETLMKGYCISCLYIRLSNHQFIGISALINRNFSPYQVRRGNSSTIPACMLLCRQAIMPAQRHRISYKAGKKKRTTNIRRHHRRHRRRLLGTKSHSSLGRFLHAPLTLMLKTPQ